MIMRINNSYFSMNSIHTVVFLSTIIIIYIVMHNLLEYFMLSFLNFKLKVILLNFLSANLNFLYSIFLLFLSKIVHFTHLLKLH